MAEEIFALIITIIFYTFIIYGMISFTIWAFALGISWGFFKSMAVAIIIIGVKGFLGFVLDNRR